MNKEKILSLLEDIKNEINKPKKIQLEEKNLKISSDGWIKKTANDGTEYLESPAGDCWELMETGEQLFTRGRAMAEAKKLGKRLPTNEELEQLKKEDYGNVIYSGFRYTDGSFDHLGTLTHFWSSTVSGTSAWFRHLNSSGTTVYFDTGGKAYGFSVRLVKE
jgi:hypothetical protein